MSQHETLMGNDIAFVDTPTQLSIPIAVILNRTIDSSKKWAYPSWSVYAVVTGENIQGHDQRVTVHDDGQTKRYFWGGLNLQLFKDGSEGYWYNLLSDSPYLFVVCNGELSDRQIEPRYVTANQDEATGHLEAEDLVLSIHMPSAIRDVLERYVICHYKPVKKKKRKRKDWLEDSLYAKKRY